MQFIGIIPARYASSRFPGKPLAMVRGVTMIKRVYEQVLKCRELSEVVVATDDKRILDHVNSFGKAVMTRTDHLSGTDRCLEAFDHLNRNGKYNEDDCIINIQGDEPFIDPGQVTRLTKILRVPGRNIATLVKKIVDKPEINDPNRVKVVISSSGRALYFSRSPVPYTRVETGIKNTVYYSHIGIYGFRAKTLREIVKLPESSLEKAEKLEQLRWLQQDYEIFVEETYTESLPVDTPEDLEAINSMKT